MTVIVIHTLDTSSDGSLLWAVLRLKNSFLHTFVLVNLYCCGCSSHPPSCFSTESGLPEKNSFWQVILWKVCVLCQRLQVWIEARQYFCPSLLGDEGRHVPQNVKGSLNGLLDFVQVRFLLNDHLLIGGDNRARVIQNKVLHVRELQRQSQGSSFFMMMSEFVSSPSERP